MLLDMPTWLAFTVRPLATLRLKLRGSPREWSKPIATGLLGSSDLSQTDQRQLHADHYSAQQTACRIGGLWSNLFCFNS